LPLATTILTTTLAGRPPDRHGKVRDIYDFDDCLLIVATDRLSAFDHVFASGIPDKGKILTQISSFWFARTGAVVPNHVLSTDIAMYPAEVSAAASTIAGRSMLVKRTTPLPIECVVRGYLAGSAWKEYRESGTVCGSTLPPGLLESAKLAAPIFTPATKAETGHDINISEAEAAKLVGVEVLQRAKTYSLKLYAEGSAHAESCGIVVADTKFEFGLLPGASGNDDHGADRLIVIDEMLTPDSSRFWPRDEYKPGGPQPSFDKQFVRDYLEAIHWNKQPPVPALPEDVLLKTRQKYLEAFVRLTGRELA
jgi:phosphoribosylaminoimidazole-succinocarboxamide synthase